jgi:hypothetical protein
MAAHRNMGLTLAETGGTMPDFAWLYFALCQFPIYMSPHLLTPIEPVWNKQPRVWLGFAATVWCL